LETNWFIDFTMTSNKTYRSSMTANIYYLQQQQM